jgi:hypothetical protein
MLKIAALGVLLASPVYAADLPSYYKDSRLDRDRSLVDDEYVRPTYYRSNGVPYRYHNGKKEVELHELIKQMNKHGYTVRGY